MIDIRNGVVVHAVAGQRHMYRPLSGSVLVDEPNPVKLVEKIVMLGFRKVYIADLTAIEEGVVTVDNLVKHCVELGLEVLVDIGRAGLQRLDTEQVRYVIGSEYLALDEVDRVRDRVTSLDLDGEYVRTRAGSIHYSRLVELLSRAKPSTVIVLRLDIVGTGRGVDELSLQVVQHVRESLPDAEVYYGGGVSSREDIAKLARLGIRAVLIATALHRGVISEPVVCLSGDDGVLC